MGRIFVDRGNRTSPTHSRKRAVRHRHFVSSALIQGRPQTAGSVARVPAAQVEAAIVGARERQWLSEIETGAATIEGHRSERR
jgi:site-specific DNA recombinase